MPFQQHHQALFGSIMCFQIVNLFLFTEIKMKSICARTQPDSQQNESVKVYVCVCVCVQTTHNKSTIATNLYQCIETAACLISNIQPCTVQVILSIKYYPECHGGRSCLIRSTITYDIACVCVYNKMRYLKDLKSARKRDKMHQNVYIHKIALTHRIASHRMLIVFTVHICKRMYPSVLEWLNQRQNKWDRNQQN